MANWWFQQGFKIDAWISTCHWSVSIINLIGQASQPISIMMKPFSDYCCTADEWSPDYAAYVKQRGYHLHSVANYGKWPFNDLDWPQKWPWWLFLSLSGHQSKPHLQAALNRPHFDLWWPQMTTDDLTFLGKIIEKVGFENVQAIDKTNDFISILSNELEIFAGIKDEFLAVRFFIFDLWPQLTSYDLT